MKSFHLLSCQSNRLYSYVVYEKERKKELIDEYDLYKFIWINIIFSFTVLSNFRTLTKVSSSTYWFCSIDEHYAYSRNQYNVSHLKRHYVEQIWCHQLYCTACRRKKKMMIPSYSLDTLWTSNSWARENWNLWL